MIALTVWLENGGEPVFSHIRIGRGSSLFQIQKFCSMPLDADSKESRHSSGLRVTGVGRILRHSSLDEMPQLLNVIRGETSLFGPRPPLPSQEDPLLLRRQTAALGCKPGLTDLAQISGYVRMPDDDQAGLDAQYAGRISFGPDFSAILLTFTYLLRRPPVY
ncbi:MAG: sugar transferase [Gemmatimonadota bacterium]